MITQGEHITDGGPHDAVAAPTDAEQLEFPTLTLVPVLVACHSHLNLPGDGTSIEEAAADGDDPLLLRSGENACAALESVVTTLSENGVANRTAFSVKEAIRRGIIRVPRFAISGRRLTMTGGHCWPLGGKDDGAEALRRAVRQLVKEGAD